MQEPAAPRPAPEVKSVPGCEDAAPRWLAEGGLRCGVGGRADVHSQATETRSLRAAIRPAIRSPPPPAGRRPHPRPPVVHTTTAEGNRKDHHEITNRTTSARSLPMFASATSPSPISPSQSERPPRRHGSRSWSRGAPPAFENSPATLNLANLRAAPPAKLSRTRAGWRRPGHRGLALVVPTSDGTGWPVR